jgi:hypothetical protein
MDNVTPQILLGIAGNLATDIVKIIWRKATTYLSPKSKQIALLVDETGNEQTYLEQEQTLILKEELTQIMQMPEMKDFLEKMPVNSQGNHKIDGVNNTIIQGANNSTISINNSKTYNIDRIDNATLS